MVIVTPPRSLNKEPRNIAPCFRFLLYLLCDGHHAVVEPDSIDRDARETSVVLQGTRNKGLREEEARDPKDIGDPRFVPLIDEI